MNRSVVVAMLVVVAALTMPAGASAHTDVEYTLPANGAAVGDPIERITVAFTEPVTLVGNGFQVFNPQGEVVVPTPITDDDVVFRLILDEPLAGGEVGVIYEVTSADGHVVSGGFRFLVDAPVPTTTIASTTVPAPTTIGPPNDTTNGADATTSSPSPVDSTDPSETTVVDATTVSTAPDVDGSGSTGLIIGGAVAIAIAAAAFVLFRGRSVG